MRSFGEYFRLNEDPNMMLPTGSTNPNAYMPPENQKSVSTNLPQLQRGLRIGNNAWNNVLKDMVFPFSNFRMGDKYFGAVTVKVLTDPENKVDASGKNRTMVKIEIVPDEESGDIGVMQKYKKGWANPKVGKTVTWIALEDLFSWGFGSVTTQPMLPGM